MFSIDLYQFISLLDVKFCSGTNRKFPLEIFIEVRACNNKNLKNLVRRYLRKFATQSLSVYSGVNVPSVAF